MAAPWECPRCKRRFTQVNQRHACGTGDRADVLRNRPPEIVELYAALERFVKSLGPVEFVTRERYVLLRSNRIFADLVIMSGAVRLAIHLSRQVKNRLFVKIASDRKQVTHVARLHTLAEFETMKPFLREAYEFSISQGRPDNRMEPRRRRSGTISQPSRGAQSVRDADNEG